MRHAVDNNQPCRAFTYRPVGRIFNAGTSASGGESPPTLPAQWVPPISITEQPIKQWLNQMVEKKFWKDRYNNVGTDRYTNGGSGLQGGICLDFDGVNQRGVVTHNTTLEYIEGEVFKFECSAYAADFSTGAVQYFVHKDQQYAFRVDATGNLEFAIPSVGSAASTLKPTDGAWNEVAASYDTSADEITFTLNGATQVVAFSSSPVAAINDDVDFCNANGGTFLDGKMFGAVMTIASTVVGQWNMHDNEGATALDSSGNGFHMTLVNTPAWESQDKQSLVDDFSHSAGLAFDKTSNYLEHDEITLDGDFTLAGRFQSTGSWGMLWSKTNSSNNYIWPIGPTLVRCQFNGTFLDLNPNLSTDTEVHLVVRREGSEVKIYKDGVEAASGTNAATWSIAGFGKNSGGAYYGGKAKDLQCYKRALTEDEITYLVNNTQLGDDPGNTNRQYHLKLDKVNDLGITSGEYNGFHARVKGTAKHCFWPRDEANSNYDINGHVMTNYGIGARHGKWIKSYCPKLDGSSDYGTVASYQSVFDPTANDYTIKLRYKSTNLPTGNEGLITWGNGSDRFAVGLNGGHAVCHFYDGTQYASSMLLNDTDEHVLVVTWDVSEKAIQLYVDGIPATGTSAFDSATNANFTIGIRQDLNNYKFDGDIWDVQIFTDVKSAAEISYLSDLKGTDPGTTNCEVWWPMEEGLGTEFHNVIANQYHGTWVNSPVLTTLQNSAHYNVTGGFTNLAGVLVPALIDGLTDADGNTITNPAGNGWNGAETHCNYNPDSVPSLHADNLDSYVVPTDFDFRADDLKSVHQHFMKRTTMYEDEDHSFLFCDELVAKATDWDTVHNYLGSNDQLDDVVKHAWKNDAWESGSPSYTEDEIASVNWEDSSSVEQTVAGTDGSAIEHTDGDGSDLSCTPDADMAWNHADGQAYGGWLKFPGWPGMFDREPMDRGAVQIKANYNNSKLEGVYNGTTFTPTDTASGWDFHMLTVDGDGNVTYWFNKEWVGKALIATVAGNAGQTMHYDDLDSYQVNFDEHWSFRRKVRDNQIGYLSAGHFYSAGFPDPA